MKKLYSFFNDMFLPFLTVCILLGLIIGTIYMPIPHRLSYMNETIVSAPVFLEMKDNCQVFTFRDKDNTSNKLKKCKGHSIYSRLHYCGKACWTYEEYADIKDLPESKN